MPVTSTCAPGYVQFDPDGGQIEFGAVQISLECWYGQAGAHFNFQGSDEGTLQGETCFHHGDDMPFIARRW